MRLIIETDKAPKAICTFSQVKKENTVYVWPDSIRANNRTQINSKCFASPAGYCDCPYEDSVGFKTQQHFRQDAYHH